MNKLPRITEIIKIEPFKVTVRWTTGEIRVIDFEQLFQKWGIEEDDIAAPLQQYDTFKYASIAEEKTLQWVNVPVSHIFFDDDVEVKKSSPLTFDPDVLYEESQAIEAFRLVPVYPNKNVA